MDVLFAFPPILLAIAIAAVLGAGPGSAIAAVAVVYAPLFFRVLRGSILAESAQAYVEAAEALGLGRGAILLRHVLRNAVSPVLVQTAVCLSYGILIESALSYLGIGVQPPTPSWGTILNEGKEFLALVDYKGSGLVVKLPRARVTELIEAGVGQPFAPAGKVFKEWLAVPKSDRRRWRTLLREGIAFVGR